MKNEIAYRNSREYYSYILLKAFAVLLLLIAGKAAIASDWASESDSKPAIVLDTTLDMLCFPPNDPQNTPPCPVPVGIDPSLIAPDPSGRLHIRVSDNDTAIFTVNLEGLSQDMVITAWFVHYPPNQPPPPDSIFAPIGPGLPAIAHMDSPMTPTTARFSEGLSREPNQFRIRKNGSSRLKVRLDYNPLKSAQVPLVNDMTPVTQTLAPAGSVAEQPDCCPDFPAGPLPEPIGGSFLRKFDPATGAQLKDERGRPMLVRSPGRPVAVAIIVHISGTTKGILPGVPIPPFLVDPPVTTGSFYLLGVFPLASLGMD
jgi:hypothetical protein